LSMLDFLQIIFKLLLLIVTVSEQRKARPGSTGVVNFLLVQIKPQSISGAARKWQMLLLKPKILAS
jgi:hypothetical protein